MRRGDLYYLPPLPPVGRGESITQFRCIVCRNQIKIGDIVCPAKRGALPPSPSFVHFGFGLGGQVAHVTCAVVGTVLELVTVRRMGELFRGRRMDRAAVLENAQRQGERLADSKGLAWMQRMFWCGVAARLGHLDPRSPTFVWSESVWAERDMYVAGFHAARWACGLEAIELYPPRGNGDDTPREEPQPVQARPTTFRAPLATDQPWPREDKHPKREQMRQHGMVGGTVGRCRQAGCDAPVARAGYCVQHAQIDDH